MGTHAAFIGHAKLFTRCSILATGGCNGIAEQLLFTPFRLHPQRQPLWQRQGRIPRHTNFYLQTMAVSPRVLTPPISGRPRRCSLRCRDGCSSGGAAIDAAVFLMLL